MKRHKRKPSGGKPDGGHKRQKPSADNCLLQSYHKRTASFCQPLTSSVDTYNYTPRAQKTQPTGDLGRLLDFALARFEFHAGQAHECREAADWHDCQATAARRVLTELQSLIPFRGQ